MVFSISAREYSAEMLHSTRKEGQIWSVKVKKLTY